jgi:hypothetical protein
MTRKKIHIIIKIINLQKILLLIRYDFVFYKNYT